ncbi:unnamed protein product [Peronospora belbahrii]|uniref:FYVE-type domain-containing protein n=1 Tax=Peronospora belbahrii TaxID=622444 RepID=A0AAU9L702_9STRA|nr:unnamed protein product [Peronospora belbahrii]
MTSAVHLLRDREQTRRLHYRAMRQITDVLEICLNSTRSKEEWSCLRRDKHEELYAKRTDQITFGSSVHYLAVNEAFCGFEEAFDLLHFDTTAQFQLMMKLLHGRDFKDGTLLSMRTKEHSLGDWTNDTQHAAVWFIYQDYIRSLLLGEQHLTFFQTLKMFLPDNRHRHHKHDNHSAAAPKSMGSSSTAGLNARPNDGVHKRTIALNWLPFPLSQDAALETAQQINLQYTLVVEEISHNRLRLSCVTSSFHDKNNGSFTGSTWAARAIARRMALQSVGKLEAAVTASRISNCQLFAPHQWVKNEDRACCVMCWKRFNALFRRRHHCRLCGEVICGSCCSLRKINVVNVKTLGPQKTRICHTCNNKARLQPSTQVFSINNHSNNHESRIPVSYQRVWEPLPLLESASDSDFSLSSRLLPASLKVDVSQDFVLPPPSGDLMLSRKTTMENIEPPEVAEADDDGYIGALPDQIPAAVSSKIISIKSIARSTKNLWQAMPSTSLSIKNIWSHEAPKSVDSTCSVSSSGWVRCRNNSCGHNLSSSFLHPAAMTSRMRMKVQPIRITAEESSYSSADRSYVYSSYYMVDLKEREEGKRRFDDRRTSLMSSNIGLLDRDMIADESYFSPQLDEECEEQRLKLLEVIVSPACTLIDRTIMQRSCEIAVAVAFGLTAAFIARVDEEYVLIEHTIGTCDLSAQDELLRRESLCDFVICQPQYQPVIVLNCLTDPRTRDIPMVQHLRIGFFIGISVCVRNLPIACLCTFRQEDGTQSQENDEAMGASYYDLGNLENAVHRMEHELESLVHGLEFS